MHKKLYRLEDRVIDTCSHKPADKYFALVSYLTYSEFITIYATAVIFVVVDIREPVALIISAFPR